MVLEEVGCAKAAQPRAVPATKQATRHGVNHGGDFTIILTEDWGGPAGTQPGFRAPPFKPSAQGQAPRETAVSGE